MFWLCPNIFKQCVKKLCVNVPGGILKKTARHFLKNFGMFVQKNIKIVVGNVVSSAKIRRRNVPNMKTECYILRCKFP